LANEFARELRNNATSAERELWHRLKVLKFSGWKFRRQVPVDQYIVDFACLSHRLIIEVDGATHATDDELARDTRRQRYLESQGFMLLRFRNTDVFTNIDGVMDVVVGVLNGSACETTPAPDPSPQGGGGIHPVRLK
jgi:very-short-patch-repair endonuclease